MKKDKFNNKRYYIVLSLLIIIFISVIIYKTSSNKNDIKSDINVEQNYKDDYKDTKDKSKKDNLNEDSKAKKDSEKKIKDGKYKVGKDIKAGEYVFIGEDIGGYIEVNSKENNELESIITNDVVNTFIYITLNDGEYLDIKNGYLIDEKDFTVENKDEYREGMYKVGKDIEKGQYNVYPEEDAYSPYVEISKDSRGVSKSIIFNDVLDENITVNLEDGQYIKLRQTYIKK